jgi:hypothetical protein
MCFLLLPKVGQRRIRSRQSFPASVGGKASRDRCEFWAITNNLRTPSGQRTRLGTPWFPAKHGGRPTRRGSTKCPSSDSGGTGGRERSVSGSKPGQERNPPTHSNPAAGCLSGGLDTDFVTASGCREAGSAAVSKLDPAGVGWLTARLTCCRHPCIGQHFLEPFVAVCWFTHCGTRGPSTC